MTELLKTIALLCQVSGADPYIVQAVQVNCHEYYVTCTKAKALDECVKASREAFYVKKTWKDSE